AAARRRDAAAVGEPGLGGLSDRGRTGVREAGPRGGGRPARGGGRGPRAVRGAGGAAGRHGPPRHRRGARREPAPARARGGGGGLGPGAVTSGRGIGIHIGAGLKGNLAGWPAVVGVTAGGAVVAVWAAGKGG